MTKKTVLGIELGSTRIKAILTDDSGTVIADGNYEWENKYENGYWTYSLDSVWRGLQESFANLKRNYEEKHKTALTEVSAIGISAMMHGYLAFDKNDKLLVPFRTWRNTTTGEAADKLTGLFGFNIPQRWSIAHFYQAVLNNEPHADKVNFLTTLAGYVHYKLTGKKVIGIGDASGMFPISQNSYDCAMTEKFNRIINKDGFDIARILPKVLCAGESAGELTEHGAKLLDVTGKLKPGAKFAPPEGDAGTGMVATNSILPKTANVSAGTSAFLMIVMEKKLENYYKEIDVVTTPDGMPVSMIHVNNFSSEIDAWVKMFDEAAKLFGAEVSKSELYERLYSKAMQSDEATGELTAYNFLSGEPIVGIENGRPLVVRTPDSRLNLANFMQILIYSALGSLSTGMEILKKENVKINTVCGHGGFFKSGYVAQSAMSAAVGAPVTVMKNAGEGGAWGIALLALFTLNGGGKLSDFLDKIFSSSQKTEVEADAKEKERFKTFMKRYISGLTAEKAAGEVL